jgi:hypothetical protein
MRHLGLWTILTMAIISCADKNNEIVEQKLTECYQEKFVGETLDKADPIKYYERLETYLIENKYLKGRTKRDYSDLWDNIYDSTKVISIKEFARENGMTIMTMNFPVSRGCYYDIVEFQKINDNQIKLGLELIEQMDSIGNFGDIELNKKLIKSIDDKRFDKILFRIPTLTYMYLRIEAINWEKYGR